MWLIALKVLIAKNKKERISKMLTHCHVKDIKKLDKSSTILTSYNFSS